MSVETLQVYDGSLDQLPVTEETLEEKALHRITRVLGNRLIDGEVVPTLQWAMGPEGLGAQRLMQYFGAELEFERVDEESRVFTGDRPPAEVLVAQLVNLHDKWCTLQSIKEMDGVEGKLVAIPNDYIASRLVPRQDTARSARVIRDELGPIGKHWIVIDKETNAALAGCGGRSQNADIATPGTVAGPNEIYDELDCSLVNNGGLGNFELQMVITSPLDVWQVNKCVGQDSAGIRTVIATLFDPEAMSKMAREKDNAIHRLVIGKKTGISKVGFNIVGDSIKIAPWKITDADNRYKCLAAMSADL